ncbi:MAG TPA: ATP-binding cassette domain-containing protein [Polyangia bacterium]|nr:ATP-binding cassette domain-containing protein [Polyangia bacterium]
MSPGRHGPMLRLTDGLRFSVVPFAWSVPPLRVEAGRWVALVPGREEPVVDPAVVLSRILATLHEPERGCVELLGQDVYRMEYLSRQRLRARIGFVQGYGGLLSNRTLRENIALPVSVHGGLDHDEEEARVSDTVQRFALDAVAGLRPHEVDGATRWRACVARALVLSPGWLVLEGIGDWEMDRGQGVAWTNIDDYRSRGDSAAVICLSRQNPAFEAWFLEQGGQVVRYEAAHGGALRRSGLS